MVDNLRRLRDLQKWRRSGGEDTRLPALLDAEGVNVHVTYSKIKMLTVLNSRFKHNVTKAFHNKQLAQHS